MNRRGFFGLFAAAAVTAIAAPDLELLVPTRTIFLPPAGGWRTHAVIPRLWMDVISQEALIALEVNSVILCEINREYDPAFATDNRTATINIRKPPRYDIRVGDRITIEGVQWPS